MVRIFQPFRRLLSKSINTGIPIFIISIDFNTRGVNVVFKFMVVRLFFCSVYGLNFRQKRDNFQDTTTTTVGGKVKTI